MSISTANKVFIVLATYNPNIEFFKKQVNSIKSQKYSDWFCLVTDDGSDPDHLDKINQLLSDEGRFRLTHSKKLRGSVNNFAQGLAQINADYKYVALCDQDDIWEDSKLEMQINILDSDPNIVMVHSDLSLIDKNDNMIAPSCWKSEKREIVSLNSNFISLIYRNVATGCTMVFRSELLDSALPMFELAYPAPYHHDVWLALHALCWGKIFALDRPLVRYRQHAGNLVGAEVRGGFLKKLFFLSEVKLKSKNAYLVRAQLAKDFIQSVDIFGKHSNPVIDRHTIESQLRLFTLPLSFYNFVFFCKSLFLSSELNIGRLRNKIQIAFGYFLLWLEEQKN